MSKPRVPEFHILDEGLDMNLFLGDKAAQAKAAETVVEMLDKGGIFVILGATRTGKGTTFTKIETSAVARHPDIFVSGNLAGAEEERHGLARTTASHQLVRSATDMEAQFLQAEINEAQAIRTAHPHATVVIDALLHENRLPGGKQKPGTEKDRQMLSEIAAANPDVTFVRTQHDLAQVKQAVWKLHETLAQDFSFTGNAIREEIFDGQRGVHADAVVKALNNNDRAAYDQTFDTMTGQATGSGFADKASAPRKPRQR